MRRYWGLFLVLLLSWWAIAPLTHSGFFPMHDDTQVVRVQQMTQALKDGQFPVRWVPDLGYGFGYPLFNFYAPLAYYVGAFFNLIGLDALWATKLMFMVGILLSGALMYLLAREFWGEAGGVASGLFYLYAPYHAVDIYVRGAVGEFWAMAFLPLVAWGMLKLFNCSIVQLFERKWLLVSSLSLAAVILSHNLTAMMITPILLIAILPSCYLARERRASLFHCFIVSLFLGLGLSAFYWLPALSEMEFTKVLAQIGGGADWRDHFVFFDQLWASPWGFGGSAPGRLDGMSFMIGKLHVTMAIIAIFSYLARGRFSIKKKNKSFWLFLASFSLLVLSIFFTNQLSRLIWELIPPLAFIQYPWRFLTLATFAASLMAGSVVLWLKEVQEKIQDYPGLGTIPGLSWIGMAIVILALLFLNNKYFKPQLYLDVSAASYISEENIKWKTSKISDEYLPKDFPAPQNKNQVAWGKVSALEGEAEIKNLVLRSHRYDFEVVAKTESKILVNTAYFPGWKVWVEGKETDFVLDNGKVKLILPAGDHKILVRFANTPIRVVANLISLASWLTLIGFIFLGLC